MYCWLALRPVDLILGCTSCVDMWWWNNDQICEMRQLVLSPQTLSADQWFREITKFECIDSTWLVHPDYISYMSNNVLRPQKWKENTCLCLVSVLCRRYLSTIAFRDDCYILDNFDILKPQKNKRNPFFLYKYIASTTSSPIKQSFKGWQSQQKNII